MYLNTNSVNAKTKVRASSKKGKQTPLENGPAQKTELQGLKYGHLCHVI